MSKVAFFYAIGLG